MAVTASSISSSNTLEQLRTQFNNLVSDVTGLEAGSQTFTLITSSNITVAEDGTIVFEGATNDDNETTLTVVDPTADRTITLPNASGTVIISDSSTNVTTLPDDLLIKDGGTIGNASVADVMTLASTGIVTFKDDLLIKDGGTIGVASSTSAITIASTGIVTLVDDLIIKDGGTIGSASATGAITIASTGIVTFVDDIIIKDAGTIGSASDTDAISISSGGVVNISATTANTGTGDGALTVAGGVGIAADASIGDDLRLISDSAVLSFGADSDTTLTHTDGTGLTLNSTNKLTFGDTASFVQQSSDGVLRIDGEATIDLNASTAVTVSNDLKLDSDSAVLSFGSDSEITVTHVADTGLNIKHTATADDKPIILTLQTGETDMAANDVMGAIRFQAPDEGTGTDAVLVAAAIQAVSEGDFAADNNATKLEFHTGASEAASSKMSLSSGGNLTVTGNVSVGGDLDVTGSFDMSDANITNVGSIALDSISGDGDSNTSITFSGSDVITFATGGSTAATFNSSQALTLSGNLLIPDGGNIGSASDTDAIAISSGGVVTVSATTANTSASDGALVVGGGVGVGADLTVGDDLRLITDSAVLSFGADSDTTLTHTDGSGLTINSTNKIMFRDSALSVSSSADGQLDIDADTEVEITATTVDINGAVEISGTTTQTGVSTSAAKDIFNAGLSVKNGSSSAGFIEFFEDSDNGTNKVTLIGPASSGDVTLTLPAVTDTVAAVGDITALAIALG